MYIYFLLFSLVSSLNRHPKPLSDFINSGVQKLQSFNSNPQTFSIKLQKAFIQKPKVCLGISGMEMSINYLKDESNANFINFYGDNFELFVDLKSIEQSSMTLSMFYSARNFLMISISYIVISQEINFLSVQIFQKYNQQTTSFNQRKIISYHQTFSSPNQFSSTNTLVLLPFLNGISINGNQYFDPIQNIIYTWPLEVQVATDTVNNFGYLFNFSIFSSNISKISCNILIIDLTIVSSYATIKVNFGYLYSDNVKYQQIASSNISNNTLNMIGINTLIFMGITQNIKFDNLDFIINIDQINLTYFSISGNFCQTDSPYLYPQNDMCYKSCLIDQTHPNICLSACNYSCLQCTHPSTSPNQCTKCSESSNRILDNIQLICKCKDGYQDVGIQQCKILTSSLNMRLIIGIVVTFVIIIILLIIFSIYRYKKNKTANETTAGNPELIMQISHDRSINTFSHNNNNLEENVQKRVQVSV